MPAEPTTALPPRSASRSEHAARCEGSVSETPRAAADRDAATPRKTSRSPRRPGKEKSNFEQNAPPGFSPPHAASRTFSTTQENVRSDEHYVGKTGLRLSPARQGGALPCFARPAARCRPNQTRHCRRVVRLGANTLHGWRTACPKRRVGKTGLRLGWMREDRAPPRLRTTVAPLPRPKTKTAPGHCPEQRCGFHWVFVPSWAPR